MKLALKKSFENIQTAAYNGAHMVPTWVTLIISFVLLGSSSLNYTKRPRNCLVKSSPISIKWGNMTSLHLWFLSNTLRSLWKMLIGWTLPLFQIGILIISILALKLWKGVTCWKLMARLWNDPNICWWEFLLVRIYYRLLLADALLYSNWWEQIMPTT